MAAEIFIALVRQDGAFYRARFPDFPDLAAEGGDLVSLLNAAREMIDQELKRREAAGEDWPQPGAVEEGRRQAHQGLDTLMLVDVSFDDRPIRVNISIGERLLKRLDEVAKAKDMSRSGFIAASVRRNLGAEFSDRTAGTDARSQNLRDEIANVGRRVNEALGPESSFGRKLSDLDARALDGLRSLSSLIGAKTRAPSPPEDGHPARADAAPGEGLSRSGSWLRGSAKGARAAGKVSTHSQRRFLNSE